MQLLTTNKFFRKSWNKGKLSLNTHSQLKEVMSIKIKIINLKADFDVVNLLLRAIPFDCKLPVR